MYYYMFSDGDYDDYHVQGVFTSSEDLDAEKIVSIMREYYKQKYPQIKDKIDKVDVDKLCDPFRMEDFMYYALRGIPEPKSSGEKMKIYQNGGYKEKMQWLEKNELETALPVEILEYTMHISPLEFTEIHANDLEDQQ